MARSRLPWIAGLLGASLLLPGGQAVAAGFKVFPPSNLYPRYIADPRAPRFGVMLLGFPSPRIPDSGDQRAGLKLGGRFGLVRFHPPDQPERGWQVDIERTLRDRSLRISDDAFPNRFKKTSRKGDAVTLTIFGATQCRDAPWGVYESGHGARSASTVGRRPAT